MKGSKWMVRCFVAVLFLFPVLIPAHGIAYEVVLTRSGYEPYTFSIKCSIDYSGWIIRNVFFWGGLIGLTIDAATGEFYELSTDDPFRVKGKSMISVKLKPAIKENE